MPPTITAPPAAPAEKPSTTPPPEHSDDGGSLAEEFRDLDALSASEDAKPEPKPKAEKAPAKPAPKVEAPEPDPEPEPEPEKPADKPATDKPETKQPEQKPVRAADLRTAHDNLKKEVREVYKPKVAALEAKIKELESRPSQEAELKTAMTRLEAVEKRKAELEEEIRYVNFQKSEEFTTKYDQPYKEAWAKAASDLSEITVELEDGTTRTATVNDLVALSNMPLGDARRRAKELFGDAAEDVMAHRRKIKELAEAQDKAMDDARKNGAEREKVRALEFKATQEKAIRLWVESNENLAKKYPQMFAPEEGDDEGNTMLEKGYKLVDRHFAPTEDNPGPQSLDERVRLDALIRNKAANHDRLALRVKRSRARIAELEKSLAAYEASAPPAGKAGKSAPAPTSGNWQDEAEAEIDAMNRD